VRKAEVSFSEKRAVVRYAPGAVTVEDMIQAVNKLGFRARETGRK
jgi:copper chaperone CopZ